MAYFFVVHQLLKKSASSTDSHFTKAISMKIKPFIAEFSKYLFIEIESLIRNKQ